MQRSIFILFNLTFLSEMSAKEIGTSRASMNRTGKTRAAQGVKKHYNEYKDFLQREVEAHICASFMEMLDMKTLDDESNLCIPSKDVSKESRQKWFMDLCQEYVERYLGYDDVMSIVNQTNALQKKIVGPFICRSCSCEMKFVHHSGRVRCDL